MVSRMKLAVATGTILIGFLLLVLSTLWVRLFPGTARWTPEKAQQWSDVKERLHNLTFVVDPRQGSRSMHSGPDRGEALVEYEQLKDQSDLLAAEFQSARDRPQTAAAILKWTGISLAGLGIVGWLIVKDS